MARLNELVKKYRTVTSVLQEFYNMEGRPDLMTFDHPTNVERKCQKVIEARGIVPAAKAAIKDSIKKNRKKKGPEATSTHEQIPVDRLRKCVWPVFYDKSSHDKKFWGTLSKVNFNGKSFFSITEHQVKPGVYVVVDNKRIDFPPRGEWTFIGNGIDAIGLLPASKLMIPNMKALNVTKSFTLTDKLKGMMFGFDPIKDEFCVCCTDVTINGATASHSASTANYSCGSPILDCSNSSIIGLHYRTDGRLS